MCFSASASFGAGIILSTIGVITIKKVKQPKDYLFASIPFLFAIQQVSEGILWLIIPNNDYLLLQNILAHIFIFFAQVFWPFLVPLAIMLFDKKKSRTIYQKSLVIIGFLCASYFGYCLLFYPIKAEIIGHHVFYRQFYPTTLLYASIVFYGLAILIPPFISHSKKMWILGLASLISFSISAFFYKEFLISVWCFFASIISVIIYLVINEKEKLNQKL